MSESNSRSMTAALSASASTQCSRRTRDQSRPATISIKGSRSMAAAATPRSRANAATLNTAVVLPLAIGPVTTTSRGSKSLAPDRLGKTGELAEVWLALLDEGVAALLRLLREVVEQRGVARQLLNRS